MTGISKHRTTELDNILEKNWYKFNQYLKTEKAMDDIEELNYLIDKELNSTDPRRQFVIRLHKIKSSLVVKQVRAELANERDKLLEGFTEED